MRPCTFAILVVLAGLLLRCGPNANVAGNTSETGNVVGKMVNEEGEGVPSAKVRLLPADHNPVNGNGVTDSAVTDSDGHFSMSADSGTYNVLSDSGDLSGFEDSVVVDVDTVTIVDTLKPPGRITGVSFMPGQDSANQARVTIYAPGTYYYTKPDIGGSFSFEDVPEGTFRLIFDPTLDDYFLKVITVAVVADETTDLDTVILYGTNITGLPEPNAGSDSTVSVGDTIALYGSAKDTLGEITKYEWDIGNTGNFEECSTGDTTIVASADSTGAYECVLRVTDNDGNSVLDTIVITVAQDKPTVSISGSSTVAINTPIAFSAQVSQQFGSIVKYRWDNGLEAGYDDSTGASYTHSFLVETTAVVGVEVTDDDGNTSTATKTVVIANDDPVITGLADTSISINDVVTLVVDAADSNGVVAEYYWCFGDGSASQYDTTASGTASHQFPVTAMECTVTVTVADSFGKPTTDSAVVSVLLDAPVPDAGADTSVSIGDSFVLHFSGTDAYGTVVTYRIDTNGDGVFEESSTSSGQAAFVGSSTAGDYNIVVQAEDDDGNTANDTMVLHVLQDVPVANAGDGIPVASLNDNVALFGTATDLYGAIVKWEWDLGNTGTYLETPDGEHTISVTSEAEAFLECVLRVTDDDGNRDSDTLLIFVKKDFGGQKNGNMVLIPRGFFVDDVETGWEGDTAFVTYDFWVDSVEVTEMLWDSIMGDSNSSSLLPQGQVSWYDAILYCNASSKAKGFDTVYAYDGICSNCSEYATDTLINLSCNWSTTGYRLPTNDEWELAARSGQQFQYPTDDGTMSLAKASYIGGAGRVEVASFPASPFGLYDMAGNVWEWCWDWENNRRTNGRIDFTGVADDSRRVIRGGAFSSDPHALMNANRNAAKPGWSGTSEFGFRVVLPAQ